MYVMSDPSVVVTLQEALVYPTLNTHMFSCQRPRHLALAPASHMLQSLLLLYNIVSPALAKCSVLDPIL